MKVSTDSLLFGSWVAHWLNPIVKSDFRVLDIGSGSGLLSLMIAQAITSQGCHNSFAIDGVEIDEAAVIQSRDNARQSPWADSVQFCHSDINEYVKKTQNRYDLIITNPPYFSQPKSGTKAFASQSKQRKLARSNASLGRYQLFSVVEQLLQPEGVFTLVLPTDTVADVLSIAASYGLKLAQRLNIKASDMKHEYRCCLTFDRRATICSESTLTIYNSDGQYTPEYRLLCKPYYQHF